MFFFLQNSCYLPKLPNVVGTNPSVPRTSGWIVSPRYTGRASEAMPTQNPEIDLPAKTIGTFTANAINRNAVTKTIILF